MIREIKYTILDDNSSQKIEPSTKQWAGMQYENNATKVSFDITALVGGENPKISNPVCRIDFNSSSAGYDPSENLAPVDEEGKTIISREIPSSFTKYGGEIQITAVITDTEDTTSEVKDTDVVAYSFPVVVFFTAVKKEAYGEGKIVENLSAMEQKVKKSIEQTAITATNDLNQAVSDASEKIDDTVSNAKTEISETATNAVTIVQTMAELSQTYSAEAQEASKNASTYKDAAETARDETNNIKNDLQERLNTTPKIFEGNKISIPQNNTSGIITLSNDTIIEGAKIGDKYINLTKIFECISSTNNMQRWKYAGGALLKYSETSELAQSGMAVAEAVEPKEDKSNKVTDLTDEPPNHTFYASALAVYSKIRDAVGNVFYYFENITNGKENATNKAKTYDDVDKTSQTQYLSSNAVTGYLNNLYAGIVQTFQPKEEGKTLYRETEEIYNDVTTAVVSTFTISKDKNKQPFKLDELYILISSPTSLTSASGDLSVRFNNGTSTSYYLFYTPVKNGTTTVQAYAKKLADKRWLTLYHQMSSSVAGNQYCSGYSMGNIEKYIEKITIEGLDSFPAGTRVRICGRRVD